MSESLTVTGAMLRYRRSRPDVLAIVKMFQDIHGKAAAPVTKQARSGGGPAVIATISISAELDAELRRKK